MLILQRYEFSSKSQHLGVDVKIKGVVADTTKVRIFKQITTQYNVLCTLKWLLLILQRYEFSSKSQPDTQGKALANRCFWYYKGTNFQANHNSACILIYCHFVVADTTKVRIFKQITTITLCALIALMLLLILQRYEFSSKSQHAASSTPASASCCWYYKGTNFQANHNRNYHPIELRGVVADTTKVRIFKQITT